MQLQIRVIGVTTTAKPSSTGGYTEASIAYRNLATNKVEEKKLVSFKFADVFATLSTAAPDSTWEITATKGEKYWDWTEAKTLSADAAAAPVATPAAQSGSYGRGTTVEKKTFETPEERAQRQLYIIRQNALTNAVETVTGGLGGGLDDILPLAEKYFKWTMQVTTKDPVKALLDMSDDIPF